MYRFLVKNIVGLSEFEDTQCGFKIFTDKAVNDIFPKCKINGWSFDSEILLIAEKIGYKIKDVPIIWCNNPETKVNLKGMVFAMIDLVSISKIFEFIKFCIVGFLGTAINFIILYLLTDIFKIYYIISAIFAFFVAMNNNYILNKVWTFGENINIKFNQRYVKFFIVSVVSLLFNLSFLYFFTEFLKIHYLISQIFSIIPSIAINFLGNKFWTFKNNGVAKI